MTEDDKVITQQILSQVQDKLLNANDSDIDYEKLIKETAKNANVTFNEAIRLLISEYLGNDLELENLKINIQELHEELTKLKDTYCKETSKLNASEAALEGVKSSRFHQEDFVRKRLKFESPTNQKETS